MFTTIPPLYPSLVWRPLRHRKVSRVHSNKYKRGGITVTRETRWAKEDPRKHIGTTTPACTWFTRAFQPLHILSSLCRVVIASCGPLHTLGFALYLQCYVAYLYTVLQSTYVDVFTPGQRRNEKALQGVSSLLLSDRTVLLFTNWNQLNRVNFDETDRWLIIRFFSSVS